MQATGAPFALRIDMDAAQALAREKLQHAPLAFTELGADCAAQTVAARPERWGDAVLVRKDVPTSYHLSVVVDDAWQGVSHIVRGRDLFASTDLHRLLQVLLDLPAPVYHHHRLILDAGGRKLSKSARDTSLRSLREAGATPTDIRRLVGLGA
jgi:glutamyl-Q tRNA(Asp) synthetase